MTRLNLYWLCLNYDCVKGKCDSLTGSHLIKLALARQINKQFKLIFLLHLMDSTCRSRDIKLLVTEIWPVSASLSVLKKPGIVTAWLLL